MRASKDRDELGLELSLELSLELGLELGLELSLKWQKNEYDAKSLYEASISNSSTVYSRLYLSNRGQFGCSLDTTPTAKVLYYYINLWEPTVVTETLSTSSLHVESLEQRNHSFVGFQTDLSGHPHIRYVQSVHLPKEAKSFKN